MARLGVGMMTVPRQVSEGRLVCPRTRSRLTLDRDVLRSVEGEFAYPVIGGVPRLLVDPAAATPDSTMYLEYSRWRRSLKDALVAWSEVGGEVRSRQASRALHAAVPERSDDGLFLSIGGGPRRILESLVNLNLDAFRNVDVVADAHRLPYADGSVDGIHCEAVLEHLENPAEAVAEMSRSLRAGGRVFAATPFLQSYHGYPDHFQNFTLTGHQTLFRRAGLQLVDSGACVGPAFALADLTRNFLRTQFPGGTLGKLAARLYWPAALPFRWLDFVLLRRSLASGLCSTTYVLAEKP